MSQSSHNRRMKFAWFFMAATCAWSADWPRFRGVNGAGVSLETKVLPDEIDPRKNVVWKTPLLPGHSSPVLYGGHIYLTAAELGKDADAGRDKIVDEGGKLYTYCLRRQDGKVLWKREVPRPRLERYQRTNSPASPSPAADDLGVYVFFGDFGVIAYDHDGAERWRRALGPFNNVNGHGSSPMLVGESVIMLCDQDTNSHLLALDRRTGKTSWRVERPEVVRSYTTPSLWRNQLIIPGSYYLTSYSAVTGEKLWWIGGLSWQPKSTPIIDGDTIYAHWWEGGGEAEVPTETPEFSETLAKFDLNRDGRIVRDEMASDARLQRGFADIDLASDGAIDQHDWDNYRARRASRNALLAVRPGDLRGDLTNSPAVLWRMQKFLPNVPSPLLYEGVLYLIKDGGILSTVNAATGEVLKQGRMPNALDTYYASPVAAAGKVLLLSQTGKATLLKAGGQWEVLSSADFEEPIYATPAIADNRLYLRTRSFLYCFAAASTTAR
jgi:outer membrane protein assembly factor BamB